MIRHALCLIAAMIPVTAYAAGPTVQKLLVVGDSISKHGPAPALGWAGDWGMAASTREKDYVHLFLARLAAEQGGKAPELLIAAEGGGTLVAQAAQTGRFKAFGADLAIVQMGENDNKDVSEEGFERPYEKILQAIKEGNPKVRILCAGVWSPPNGSLAKDAMIQAACKKIGAVFVDMSAANMAPANMVASEKRFTHAGVNWHPGDKGMEAYAGALWVGWTDPERASQPRPLASPGMTLLVDEKWDGHSKVTWGPAAVVEAGTLKLSSANAADSVGIDTILPLDRCVGRRLIVQTRVRGASISAKPDAWNGVKLMLMLRNAEGKDDYPQADIPVGSFDWKVVRWTWRIPDNIVSAKLHLGLERVSGTAWFDALQISIAD